MEDVVLTKTSENGQLIQNQPEERLIGVRSGLRLVLPRHEIRGTGDVIADPRSSRLIAGIEIDPIIHWPDDRGCFAEIFRFGGAGIAQNFLPEGRHQLQVSFTVSYPGVVKAIHYHFEQTDLWAPLSGMLQVFLCDLRDGSPTWGRINTFYIGEQRPWRLLIPPGVAHGYKVLGQGAAHLLYATNHFYDPADEGRIAFDDPDINYEWGLRLR